MFVAPVLVSLALFSGHGYRVDLTAAAGFPVSCHSLAEYGYDGSVAGVALVGEQKIVLSPETCRDFDRGGMFTVSAVATLAHERQHLLGITDEQEAECEGIWDVRWLGRRIGYRISRATLRRYAGPYYAPCVR